MRILHLLSQTQITGAEAYARELFLKQEAEGHSVYIASDDLFLFKPERFLSLNVHRAKGVALLKSARQLRNWLRQENIEVIHCHSRAAARLAYWARLGLNIAQVTTFHGRHPASISKRWHNIYGERTTAVCMNAKSWSSEQLKMDPLLIDLIPNPVTIEMPQTPERVPGAVYASHRLPAPEAKSKKTTEKKYLAYVTRPTGPKGQRFFHFLENDLPYLLKQHPQLSCSAWGIQSDQVPRWQQVQEKFAELGVSLQRLEFGGEYKKIEDVFKKADFVIGSGRVAISALLAQLPTLAVGEYKLEGVITQENFETAVKSNFGDIGPDDLSLNHQEFRKEFEKLFTLDSSVCSDLEKRTRHLFDLNRVYKKTMRTYQLALFKRLHWKNIPVLMYHKVPDQELNSQHRIFIRKENFELHMKTLQEHGFTSLHFKDLEDFLTQKRPMSEFPKKPIFITFDDGYKDNLTNAAPLLKKYGHKATLFLLANHELKGNSWDAYSGDVQSELMDAKDRQTLIKNFDIEVGSHGIHHLHLTQIPLNEAEKEIVDSKNFLENEFRRKILVFAYPFGSRNDHLAEICEEWGYRFAVNTDQGGRHIADQPFSIFRVNIFPEDGPQQLLKKSSWWYRWYFYFKRKR